MDVGMKSRHPGVAAVKETDRKLSGIDEWFSAGERHRMSGKNRSSSKLHMLTSSKQRGPRRLKELEDDLLVVNGIR